MINSYHLTLGLVVAVNKIFVLSQTVFPPAPMLLVKVTSGVIPASPPTVSVTVLE